MTHNTRLDNVAHADLRIACGHGAAYGDAVNQIAIFLPEFEEAQRDYPILFLRDEGGLLQSVAILGLDRDENLFLEGDGRWSAGYVPAMVRRGPFLIGFVSGEPVIHVDLDHPRVVQADHAASDPVFLPQGGQAPALERAMAALRAIHVGNEATRALTSLFDELGLVQPVSLDVQVSDRHRYAFNDYLAITPESIACLEAEALAKLNRAGLLMPAVFAASSLANVHRLIARKRARMR